MTTSKESGGARKLPRTLLISGVFLAVALTGFPALGLQTSTVARIGDLSITPPHGNVTFTGNLAKDFPSGPFYRNANASAWTADNNISSIYAAYNSTYLFLGLSEIVTGNSLMIFIGDNGASSQGTYNLSGLNSWSRGISFRSAVITFAAVYFGGQNTNLSGYNAFEITSPTSASNSTPTDRAIPSIDRFSVANDSTEVGIPLSYVFPDGTHPTDNISVSAFVVGSSGSWVGTGVPYAQAGQYNAGGSQGTFLVSDTFELSLSGISQVLPTPINVAIVFNDHQPLYQVAGNDTYNLPWTEAHATAEYIEQAVILKRYPDVNITYELSGSLLYQLWNISHFSGFNDSWIEDAYIPWNSLNTTQNSTELATLTGDWFSIPGYALDFNEPASILYKQLDSRWSSGGTLTGAQYEDAKVLWFLYEISTDLVEGRLGASWANSTIWSLHNQTSFSQANLATILSYSQWLTGQVIPAFKATAQGNPGGSDNDELFTSPFYHPLTPLLLTTSVSGPSGTLTKGAYTSDVLAQMNLSRDQFDQLFGWYPSGLYSPEAAVSEAMISLINESGARWTATDEWTLQQSGISAEDYGGGGTVTQMENLYTPYVVEGAGGTSTYMFFRDASLSNNWAFNYGNLPTATAVSDILNYLKGVYNSLPLSDHPQTLVTLMLDGENWQFLSPFADDGIPFIEDLYAALQANASMVHTVTPSQFLAEAAASHFPLPTLASVATGSWNQGSGSSAPMQSNPSLTQWSGYPAQDWMWARLDIVRDEVLAFEKNYSLVQLESLTPFEQNMTANTLEGNLTRAWYGIYNAEGSDWYFQMAPWTISGANTVPFNETFQGDLNYTLSQLHPPTPTLSGVAVSPSNVSTRIGESTNLTATASCTGGPCPGGIGYSWSLTNNLGTLNSSTGQAATFMAGSKAGTVTLFVNATLGGVVRQSLPDVITIRASSGGAKTFPADFGEVGLTPGTTWSVTLNGTRTSNSTNMITFAEPNGTYHYAVAEITGYSQSPASGNVTISGTSASISVVFVKENSTKYPVIFSERGLQNGTNWSITLNGTSEFSPAQTLSFSETNGTYNYSAGTVIGYRVLNGSGTVQVSGKAQTVEMTYVERVALVYSIAFTETGLPVGTKWSVSVNGVVGNSTSSADGPFERGNGTYPYIIGSIAGYTAFPPSGNVTVSGMSLVIAVQFNSTAPAKGPSNNATTILGLPSSDFYILLAASVVVAASAAILAILIKRKRRGSITPTDTSKSTAETPASMEADSAQAFR